MVAILLGEGGVRPKPEWIPSAEADGIDALIASQVILNQSVASIYSEPWRAALRRRTLEAALRHVELTKLSNSCQQTGIEPLVLKGAALAYRVYQSTALRPSIDIDIFVSGDESDRFDRLAAALGYAPALQVEGAAVTQRQLERFDRHGTRHVLDVHARIANPGLFADALPYAEARARAVPVPGVPGALTLDDADALFLACLHRVAHHYDAPRLIWIYDIHLLVTRLDADGWARFTGRARAAAMCAVCDAGLSAAATTFGTTVPPEVIAQLRDVPAEPSALFLRRDLREIDVQLAGVRHAAAWGTRIALIAHHLFPAPAFILARYRRRRWLWLPLLYAHRIVTGAPKWFASLRAQ